ncbi:hypothetical protein Tco_0846698 [Tanacetum coccineum]
MVAGLQCLWIRILHLNVTTVEQMVLYTLSVKLEDRCQLSTIDEIADAVNCFMQMRKEPELAEENLPLHIPSLANSLSICGFLESCASESLVEKDHIEAISGIVPVVVVEKDHIEALDLPLKHQHLTATLLPVLTVSRFDEEDPLPFAAAP